jgi:two-component system sensor histidine kinase/response regulator
MKTIMVVDDEPDQIFTVKNVLESSGGKYEVIGVNSGMQCLELLKDNRIPDLILLDIMMPEMSGWQVFYRLKENSSWKNIPVIFLTARKDEMAKGAGDFLGDDYIEKPFNREDLKKRIDYFLKNR